MITIHVSQIPIEHLQILLLLNFFSTTLWSPFNYHRIRSYPCISPKYKQNNFIGSYLSYIEMNQYFIKLFNINTLLTTPKTTITSKSKVRILVISSQVGYELVPSLQRVIKFILYNWHSREISCVESLKIRN